MSHGRFHRVILLGLQEARPAVQAATAGRFLALALLTCSCSGRIRWQVAVAVLAWTAAGISVYLFNGYADRLEDRANGSARPIASGRLAVRDALWLACGAAAVGVAASAAAGTMLQAVIYLALGYAYSGAPWPSKRHWATASFTIAASGADTFWAASRVTGYACDAVVVAGAALTAWMGLVGSLVKDLSDVPGDRLSGRRTYAVAFGPDRTGRYAAMLAVGTGLAASAASAVLAPALLPAMGILLVGGVMIAVRSGRGVPVGSRHDSRAPYRIFMISQHATLAALITEGICSLLTLCS